MGDTMIRLEMKDALYNAGLFGLYRILSQDIDFDQAFNTKANYIEFPVAALNKFDDLYVKYFVRMAKQQSVPLKKVLSDFEKLSWSDDKESMKAIKEWEAYANTKLKRDSFISAYVMLREYYGDSYDVEKKMKIAKAESDLEMKKETYEEVLSYIRKRQDILFMKEAAYGVISHYITNKCFLYRDYVRVPFETALQKEMSDPAIEYLSTSDIKRKDNCFACDRQIGSKEKKKSTMAWINDVGVDDKKKRSHFWNFKADTLICPLCQLVYLCVPAGFMHVNGHGLFFNNDVSFGTIQSINAEISITDMTSIDQLEYVMYHRMAEQFLQKSMQDQIKNDRAAEGDLKVIRRHQYDGEIEYRLGYVTAEVLNILRLAKAHTKRMASTWFEFNRNDGRRPLFSQVLFTLQDQQDLYGLMDFVLRSVLQGQKQVWNVTTAIDDLLGVQCARTTIIKRGSGRRKEWAKVEKEFSNFKKGVYAAKMAGYQLRKELEIEYGGMDAAKNKLGGTTYKLLNALKQDNMKLFMDDLIRVHMWKSKPVPSILIDQMAEPDFHMYAYAYLAGLQGAVYENKSEAATEKNKTEAK